MRFWGTNAGGGVRVTRLAATAAALLVAAAVAVPAARGADPAVTPYGQVAAVGGVDTAADFLLPGSTSQLTAGEFVDPVGMSVAADPTAPGGEDIYVLDLVDPQALNDVIATSDADNVALEYRLQKIAIAPSTADGEDSGAETVLACTTFTLQSSPSAPDQRAVSLAVNGPGDQVDVLLDEMPDAGGVSAGYSVAQQIDQWPTTLEGGAVGTCPATPTPTVAVPSTTLVKRNDPGLLNDIDGDSIAFAGTGANARLALGGSLYLDAPAKSGFSRTEPIIELFDSSGAVLGNPWKGAEAAANPIARMGPIAGKESADGWAIDQSSTMSLGSGGPGFGDVLYALSSNPDGSLNVTLGPQEYQLAGDYTPGAGADFEPIMATVSADLSSTTPILPSPQTSPTFNYPAGWTADVDDPPAGDVNSEVAATDVAEQDTADNFALTGGFAPGGGTQDGGTLAPSVVDLADGDTSSDYYAGVVADNLLGIDANLDQAGNPVTAPAWTVPNPSVGGSTANLGIRIFCGTAACASDGQLGAPAGMIGNAGPGACDIRSGAYGYTQTGVESTLAVAAGVDGALYALAQPDLDAAAGGAISPAHPVSGSGVGDILFEFKPGAGTGGNPGIACPQPSGSFSVTDVSDPNATANTGTGAVEVLQGASIRFDASPLDLQGGAPWSYTWDPGAAVTGDQTATSTFTPDQTNQVYDRPDPAQTFAYTTPGQATATLQLVSDFGPTRLSRPIDVVAPGPITAQVTAAGGALAGQPTTLSAVGTTVAAPDSIVDYHWDFGDGTSEETAGPGESWTFPSAGTYTVTLSAIDQVGRVQTATTQVTVAPPPPPPPNPTSPAPTPSPRTAHRFSVSPKLRSVRNNADLSARLSCPAGDRTCAGTIAVLTAAKVSVHGRKGRHVLSLGRGTFSVTAAHSKTVLLRLAPVTQKLISPQQPLRLSVIVIAHDSAGAHATQRLVLSLFPPRRSRPRKFG